MNGRVRTVVAVDLGTSFVKALRVNASGQVEASAIRSREIFQVKNGVVDVEKLLRAATETAEAVWSTSTEAVACSAAMHSLGLVDQMGRVLGPATTWEDRSFEDATCQLQQTGQDWWARTGTPIHPMSPAVRWWGMRAQGQVPRGARPRALKDLLIRRWTGADVTDLATAAASGLINRGTRTWDETLLAALELSPGSLPALKSPAAVAGGWKTVPVVVGTSDGAATHLGLSALGDVGAVSLGTSGAVRRLTMDEGQPVHEAGLFCYAVDGDLSLFGGALSDAGNLLDWWAGVTGTPVVDLLREAVALPRREATLMALPFWHGSRSPYWNARLQGSLLGLTAEHTRADVSRALLESIVLLLDFVAHRVETVVGPTARYVAAGGLFRAPGVGQVVASILERPLWVVDTRDAAILGCARLAFEALGAADEWNPHGGSWVLPEAPEAWQSRRDAFARMLLHEPSP